MIAESEKLRVTFSDQLASFEDRLAGKDDEVQMLAEIREAIGRLLEASADSEAEIRRVLEERFEAGELRKETYQLVKSMLDRYVTEHVPTSNDDAERPAAVNAVSDPANDDPFGSTDVIATDVFESEDADDRVQVGSVLRDRFVLQERVSGGSMGVVYKALDRRLAEAGSQEPWVAIKVLSPQLARNGTALRALQQEAAKSRCLTHPNIVRFVDFDRDEDLYFIVMEWLDGRTLADILDSPDSRQIDFDTAFRIVRQIGKALEYAHRCGIVHADVKPGNIMILPSGDARLFDFGVARVQQRQRVDDDFDPAVLGALTPAYSSMQVLTGEDPVPSDDVFSLACLLYRLVAGYRVFGPRNAAEAAEAGMTPQRLAGVSDAQWGAIRRALSYARVTRFESMGSFLEALGYKPTENTVAPDVLQHVEFDDSGGSFKWVIALLALLSLLGVAAYQFGIIDEILRRVDFPSAETRTLPPPPAQEVLPSAVQEPTAAPTVAGSVATDGASPLAETSVATDQETESAAIGGTPTENTAALNASPDAVDAQPEIELLDLARLAPADIEISIDPASFQPVSRSVTLREDSRSVSVDILRPEPLELPMTLRLDEVGFSGNRSPWRSGQFEISNGGYIEFPAGEERARFTLSMASDSRREADQLSTLKIREADTAAIALATIDVVLEDDDQRRFEAELPANTVAFAVSQVSVQERDPAVQVDLVRFNPDETRLVVRTEVLDITATAGEDFFAPGSGMVVFGPGQRSARVLIPLVQDAEREGDEAFVVELTPENTSDQEGVHNRVAIMIRDDD